MTNKYIIIIIIAQILNMHRLSPKVNKSPQPKIISRFRI